MADSLRSSWREAPAWRLIRSRTGCGHTLSCIRSRSPDQSSSSYLATVQSTTMNLPRILLFTWQLIPDFMVFIGAAVVDCTPNNHLNLHANILAHKQARWNTRATRQRLEHRPSDSTIAEVDSGSDSERLLRMFAALKWHLHIPIAEPISILFH